MPATAAVTNARLADGRLVDLVVERTSHPTVARIVTAGSERHREVAGDLSGHLVLPRFHEPHAHLDKALSANAFASPTGDLADAITAWLEYRPTIGFDDYVERAVAAVDLYRDNGVRRIRTHVDLGLDIGTVGLEALLAVKAEVSDSVEVDIVGLPVGLTGDNAAAVIQLCRQAMDLGLDMLGGVPHIEQDPTRAINTIVNLAAEYGCGIDIHADENLRPDSDDLATLCQAAIDSGFEHQITASHCVALSAKPIDEQHRIAELAAEAGVSVVVLPHTNLYLQARDITVSPPRGLAPASILQRAGVAVMAGGDNLQDPFNPMGSGDPLEVAALLVTAGHLSVEAATAAVTVTGRAVVDEGDRFDLVAIPGQSLREVVAMRPAKRVLVGFEL